jgi:nucleotide-binding universal stress UspA family protein
MLKTILVHVDLSCHAPTRIRYAAALAHARGACLTGAAMLGVSRAIFPQGYKDEVGTLSASYFKPLADSAHLALSKFEAIATQTQVPHDIRFVCDQADDGLAQLARFADMVIVSQDDPAESLPDRAVRLPEYVILNCARPVLVLPRTDPHPYTNHKILIAWDGSKEASCAVSAAIPLLRWAAGVTVVTLVGPNMSEADCRIQQQELTNFLSRHRVAADVLLHEPEHDTGETLLSLADELHCNLLVMGCFGHSKFRELCLGGASRTVLANANIPVLLAH